MSLRRKGIKPLSARQEKSAQKIADWILAAQRKLADYLNQNTSGVSPKTWLVLLGCFCVATGTYLIYLLAQVG